MTTAHPRPRIHGIDGPNSVVGRERELAAIEELLAVDEPELRALVLEGEPGIGKTTLWQAAVEAASPELQVLSCRPVEAPTPRKLKRSVANPRAVQTSTMRFTTGLSMSPPYKGWGWEMTTPTRAPGGAASRASSGSAPDRMLVSRSAIMMP